jgi:hypothetical protein
MSGPSQIPPTTPGPLPQPDPDGLETYNRIAETVGGMPTLRVRDNVVQAVVVIACTLLGAGIGYLIGAGRGRGGVAAAAGGAIGMISSALVSGLILMVLGWLRGAKRRPK